MEVQDSHPRTSNQTEVSEPFVAGESSRTNFQDINHAECTNGSNSLQISYSPSSSCLGANSTDEDRQIAEVTKGKSKQKAPQQGNELSQSSSQGSYARKNSQMDVTCSVCLSEFDNKAFLDKCFRILVAAWFPVPATIVLPEIIWLFCAPTPFLKRF